MLDSKSEYRRLTIQAPEKVWTEIERLKAENAALLSALEKVVGDMETSYDGAEDSCNRWMGEHISRIRNLLAHARQEKGGGA